MSTLYTIEQPDNEISSILDNCADAEESGISSFPGMTYEQGILEAIRWLIGESTTHPLEN